jgi:hypothetical protein
LYIAGKCGGQEFDQGNRNIAYDGHVNDGFRFRRTGSHIVAVTI